MSSAGIFDSEHLFIEINEVYEVILICAPPVISIEEKESIYVSLYMI